MKNSCAHKAQNGLRWSPRELPTARGSHPDSTGFLEANQGYIPQTDSTGLHFGLAKWIPVDRKAFLKPGSPLPVLLDLIRTNFSRQM